MLAQRLTTDPGPQSVPGKPYGTAGIPDRGHADDLQPSAIVANPDSRLEKWHTGTKGDSGCGRFLRPLHIAAAVEQEGIQSNGLGRGGGTRGGDSVACSVSELVLNNGQPYVPVGVVCILSVVV